MMKNSIRFRNKKFVSALIALAVIILFSQNAIAYIDCDTECNPGCTGDTVYNSCSGSGVYQCSECSCGYSYNCNSDDGWYCDGETRRVRDYFCSGGSCAWNWGATAENCDTQGGDPNNGDGWYCSGDTLEWRDYYCITGSGNPCAYSTGSSSYCPTGCADSRYKYTGCTDVSGDDYCSGSYDCQSECVDSCTRKSGCSAGSGCTGSTDCGSYTCSGGTGCTSTCSEACGAECDANPDCGDGTCSGSCTCNHVTDCTNYKCLYIKNSAGTSKVRFDALGNLDLVGSLSQNQAGPCSPPANSLIFKNSAGNCVAYIDSSGNMWLDGSASTLQSGPCSPPANSFVIKDSSGNCRAYIDSSGNLWLDGKLKASATGI